MALTFEDLSPEMLVKIFHHCIESEGHTMFSKNVVPVCSRWWNLSRTPSLWKSINVRNWDHALSLAKRQILYNTESVTIPGDWNSSSLDPNRLLALLSNICDLKTLEITWSKISENTMRIVARHCPNLECLRMECVSVDGHGPITRRELSPILARCGPKLKHLHLTSQTEGGEEIVSDIAAKCPSLEVLKWTYTYFPIHEIMNGCPRLRKLDLSDCDFVTTDANNCAGFKNLIFFRAYSCDFDGIDLSSLLQNSNDLEHLDLCESWNFTISDVSMIPSNKVKILRILLSDDMHLVALKQAMDKWKHTLLHLDIDGWECDITSVLESYLDGNQCPKLEVLEISKDNCDQSLLKKFIKKCQNLNTLQVSENQYNNREAILNFHNSL